MTTRTVRLLLVLWAALFALLFVVIVIPPLIGDPDLLAAFPRSGFIPATNADYTPIEATAVTIGIMDAQ